MARRVWPSLLLHSLLLLSLLAIASAKVFFEERFDGIHLFPLFSSSFFFFIFVSLIATCNFVWLCIFRWLRSLDFPFAHCYVSNLLRFVWDQRIFTCLRLDLMPMICAHWYLSSCGVEMSCFGVDLRFCCLFLMCFSFLRVNSKFSSCCISVTSSFENSFWWFDIASINTFEPGFLCDYWLVRKKSFFFWDKNANPWRCSVSSLWQQLLRWSVWIVELVIVGFYSIW